jgi:hypothetical protein
MSDILHTIDHMRARGVAAEAILEAVYALEASRADKLEQRRASDRMRQRRSRAKEPPPEIIQDVSRDTFTVVAGADPVAPPFPKPLSPDLSISSSLSSGTREERLEAQRELFRSGKAVEILEVCTKRANGALDTLSTGVKHAREIIHLLCPLEGEPVDLEADYLPAIDAKAAQVHKTGKPIRSWNWIDEIAIKNRDRRLAGLPAPEKFNERTGQGPGASNGGSRSGAYSGGKHRSGSLVVAAARLNSGDQDQADISDQSQDRRNEWLA